MRSGPQPDGAGFTRRARRRSSQPICEINITPLVGVMIVLLIIVMLAASKLTVGVDLGASGALTGVEQRAPQQAPISITIDGGGTIFLENAEIGFDAIMPKLVALREGGGGARVLLRADNGASYGDVAKVLVRIKEAGVPVTLITEQANPFAPR